VLPAEPLQLRGYGDAAAAGAGRRGVPRAVARVRRPRRAAAAEGERRGVPPAGPPRAPRRRRGGGRWRYRAAPRLLPRGRPHPPCAWAPARSSYKLNVSLWIAVRAELDWLVAFVAGGRVHGRGVRAARPRRRERGAHQLQCTGGVRFHLVFRPSVKIFGLICFVGRPLLSPAGGREAAPRRVGGRERRRRRGRGHREAAVLADAAHVLQDAHGVRHQHARRLLRAAPRRRRLLPASGTLG
jgi:hypothetical protein